MPDFGLSKDSLRNIVGLSGEFVGTTDTQVITNKTYDVQLNTLKQTSPATGSILRDNGGSFQPLARGSANQPLKVNSGGTDISYGTLPVAGGGTGATTLTGVLIGAGTSAITTKANPTGAFLDDSSAQNITGAKTFSNTALKLRNPAGTFTSTLLNPVIAADKNLKLVYAYSYIIEKDSPSGSTYYAVNGTTGCVDSSGTANTVIQYAIDNALTDFNGDSNRDKGTVLIRNNNFYTSLDLQGKSGVRLVGEGDGTKLTGKITVGDTVDHFSLSNLWLENTAADHALYLNGARSFAATDCVIYLNNTTLTKFPVLIDGGTDFGALNTFTRCKILSKGHGLKQTASATTKYNNTTMLRDSYLLYNAGGGVATGGQTGLIFDGDGVEKNLQCDNLYIESWDTAVSLDEGQCRLRNLWIDTVNTAGVDVSKAAIDQQNMYLDINTASVTTQPLLVLGGRKFYAVSPNYSMVYDARREVDPHTAWIQKYLIRNSELTPYGLLFGHNSGTAGEGLFAQITNSGSLANSGNYSNGSWVRYTSAAGGTDNAGFRYTGTPFTYRGWNPTYFAKMRIFDKANTRGWFGLFSPTTEPTGDDWLNAGSGFGLGWKAGDANWQEIHNDGTGATVYTDTGIVLASNTIYTLEIRFEDTTPRVGYSINEAAMAFQTSELPAQQTALCCFFQVEETAAAAKLLDRFMVYVKVKGTA